MTINERIKKLRKDNKLNQKQFAAVLGITQSGVSYMEQDGSTVTDASIKSICSIYNINENWLRTGAEPMRSQPNTFSLDQFVQDHGASDLEKEIMKAYFELDPEIRKTVLNHFKGRFSSTAPVAEPTSSEPSTEELEAEYKKSNLNSASSMGYAASNITGDTSENGNESAL